MRTLITLLLLCAGAAAPAQDDRVLGAVTGISASSKIITIRTDAGAEVTVSTEDTTKFLKVAPGATSLQSASPISFGDVAAGDRVLARGKRAADQGSMVASTLVVMSRTELEKKHEADRAEWREKGVAGSVTAVDAANQEITIRTGRGAEARSMVVSGKGANYRRYAADSVRFSDAKPSSHAGIRIGDQLRALGERTEDGSRLNAREIVFGTFRNIAGTVISVDVADETVVLQDLASKKPVSVRVTADSLVRRLPPTEALMLAQRVQSGGASPGGTRRPDRVQAAQRQNDSPSANRSGQPVGANGRMDLQQILDGLPQQPISDLKPGDAVLVASTEGTRPGAVTAIALLSGAEPILTAAPKGPDPFGGDWNFSADVAEGAAQ